ncbi:DNA-binding protein [Priestia megaterium]|uniref:DNA-binding protein n=1 Tax=Priestia megaterium TaxID=1404 RepID=UPI001A944CC4|nr:DNA-binding protein [Priestia megaterium]QSX24486.1 DNA-binding protein [Priestia megaterium]
MQRKFRLDDEAWNQFIEKTDTPSETLRELVISFINEDYPLNQLMGVDDASKLWGLKAGYIKNLCAAKKIKSKKIGNSWVIDKNQKNPSQTKSSK